MAFQSQLAYIVLGPTASGKSAYALDFAARVRGEIINCDMPQCYTPLSIGTAKPSVSDRSLLPHHLFDLFNEPLVHNAVTHRALVEEKLRELWLNNKTPIIVGGSTFYLFCLFFTLQHSASSAISSYEKKSSSDLWQKLRQLDPVRASHIHPHDRYRLCRALDILACGKKPSEHGPILAPLASFQVVYLNPSSECLSERIMARSKQMLQGGLIEGAQRLCDKWRKFAIGRNIIGYPEVFSFLEKSVSRSELECLIVHSTVKYAKKQRTFFKMLHKKTQSIAQWDTICAP